MAARRCDPHGISAQATDFTFVLTLGSGRLGGLQSPPNTLLSPPCGAAAPQGGETKDPGEASPPHTPPLRKVSFVCTFSPCRVKKYILPNVLLSLIGGWIPARPA